MAEDPILQAGALGPYRIERRLGHGSMGTVYLGFHQTLQVRHAVKVLHPELAGDRVQLSRFLREARLAGKLRHPNLIPVVGADRVDGWYYLAMPHVEGETLAELALRRPLPARRAVRYALMIARGLQHAHDQGIVHRDVKAANILIDREGVARLTDFGLVRELHPATDEADGEERGSDAATVLGTPQYMPPEQWGGGVVDRRTDIFALGVTLYFALTGEYPNAGHSLREVCTNVLHGEAVPVYAHRPQINADLARIVEKPIRRDPDQRFQSATEFADALEEWLATHPEAGAPVRRAPKPAVALVASGVHVAAVPVAATALRADRSRTDPASSPVAATSHPLEFAELLARLDHIPALPLVYHEVRRLATQRSTDARTLTRAIEKDPALSSRVLKLANSAIYSFRARIAGLHLAVSLLGNHNVLGLTSSLVVLRQFRRPGGSTFDPARFWQHGVLAGCAAVELNTHYKWEIKDDLFTFGLVHDIGKIAVYENLPEHFDRIVAAYESGAPYRAAEKKVLGVDHTVVGSLLAEQWKLPNDYVECIRTHHEMPHGMSGLTERRRFLVFLGNVIAHMSEAKQLTGRYPTLKPEFLERFRFTQESIQALAERAAETAEQVGDCIRA